VQHCAADAVAVPVGVQRVVPHRPPTQFTEQQSPSLAHVAPACLQNSAAVHVPPAQTVEQHCEPLEQTSAVPRHAGGGGAAQ
jgi:hypothetical protein